ncbi:islet cell autoantigen 1-like isoform X2 [Mizuhopecten yessoensis]|uniref:Islet cell autoantigen 1 n=2 Tax=Mizuhopecten yessoensis TaxID=6573 RepID=A0A210PH84_MIZYE|nr:islet cell autoantigen 1-like isoform X2 [Mizuhopecten yessoensis]OWF35849.1 Islet cell autoantigen 1 [Mizuhopecten yessoensis]
MSHGYSGSNYDRHVERTETSTLHKMKETFWTTKQAVIQKLGKKEDEHVVASDAQLDSKLEVFRAIQKSSMELLHVIEKYQDRLCALSQDENSMGRFLKSQSNIDKTRAGKMMAAVGKSQSFAAQQRLSLRVPLVRLYQEVETFRYRAISDTLMTINRMEGARTEYRGALLWMKAVSEELDPDTFKQLEKFRKVQGQVRKTKARFDKLKLDVMQKVDLLAASRCNMFSHVLANYQSTLLHFWEKTSRTLSAVAESFKGYQHYEFSIIKELAEPSKRLENSSRLEPAERDTDEEFDPTADLEPDSGEESTDHCPVLKPSCLTDDTGQEYPDDNVTPAKPAQEIPKIPAPNHHISNHKSLAPDIQELDNLIDLQVDSDSDRLLSLEDESVGKDENRQTGSLQNLYEGESDNVEEKRLEGKTDPQDDDGESFMEFGDFVDDSQEEFDFSGKILSLQQKHPMSKLDKSKQDLLCDDIEQEDTEKDDMTILNEILNAPSTGGDDFTREWQAVFGNVPLSSGTTYTPVESDQPAQPAEFMPSNLLDLSKHIANQSNVPTNTGTQNPKQNMASGQELQQSKPKGAGKKGEKKDMSAWFNLFADLDPLSNPDAIGKSADDMSDAQM